MRAPGFFPLASAVSAAMILTATVLLVSAAEGTTVALWHMDETSGDSVADAMGVHDGAASDAPIVAGPNLPGLAGAANRARQFDGSQTPPVSYIEVPDHADWDLGSQFTLEAWAYPTEFLGASIVRHFDATDDNRSWWFGLYDQPEVHAAISIGVDGNGSELDKFGIVSPEDSVVLNQWQWFTATFDSGLLRLYIDGNPVAAGTVPVTSVFAADAPVWIGASRANPGQPITNSFPGLLDEVRILDLALSQEEVLDRYQSFFVPEASTGLLLAFGLVGVALRRRLST